MELFVGVSNQMIQGKRSKKPYGDWSESYEFKVQGVSLDKDAYFSPDVFEVPFEVVNGDKVYVLHITFSSGDSFGTARGQGTVLAVFKDWSLANAALDHVHKNEEEYDFFFVNENGEKFKVHNVAYGYFEHITSSSVDEIIIGKEAEDNDYDYY